MADFIDRALDLASEFLPLDQPERRPADGQRRLYHRAQHLVARAAADALLGYRDGLELLFQLQHLAMQQDEIGELLGGIGADFQIRSEERRVGKECRSRW